MKLTLRTGKSEEKEPKGVKDSPAEEKAEAGNMKIKVKVKIKNESAKKMAKAMVKKDKKIQKY